MRAALTIWRREWMACFLAPVAYVTMVAFLAASGFTFWIAAFRNVGRPEPLAVMLYGSVAFWLPILITVVAMRLFVEEKRSGTIETLLTAPVSERAIVMGKYGGALTFLALAVAPTVLDVFIIERLSPAVTLENVELGGLIGGGIILALVTAAFLALSLVISLLTRNQITAAICSFVVLWIAMLGGWLLQEIPGFSPRVADYLSVTHHIESFARGVVDLRTVVFYLSGTAFLLFAATRMLESRRWR
jgi:ABC-2 type transport system permease protein